MTVKYQHELPLLGVLPQNWRVVEFGDVLYGGTRNGVYKPKEFHGQGDKIVNMGELFAHPRLFNVPMKRVQLSDSEQQRFRLEVGDLLFARRSLVASGAGKCSIVCEIGEPTTFESSLIRGRPNPQIVDSFFLYYLFRSHYGAYILDSILRHVTVAGITGTDLVKLPIPLPPLPEQKAIAHILSSLDEKIELNQQMNRTLEAQARAIFKSWFVDFDPVRAKIDGMQPVGMDAATAALFPDKFEESPLGMIPKGWIVSTIGESVQVFGGSTPSTKNPAYWEGGNIHWATPKDLSTLQHPVFIKTERKITKLGLVQISSGLLPQGTVLLSSRAPIGYLAISEIPIAVNQGFIAMVCNQVLSNYYVLYWTLNNLDTIKGRANGTTFLEISKSNFRPILIIIPKQKVLEQFNLKIEPLHKKIVNNIRESQILATLRDTLLPKLISGEIRVKEAEKMVREAA